MSIPGPTDGLVSDRFSSFRKSLRRLTGNGPVGMMSTLDGSGAMRRVMAETNPPEIRSIVTDDEFGGFRVTIPPAEGGGCGPCGVGCALAVWAAVFPNFQPHYVCLVLKPPGLHNL